MSAAANKLIWHKTNKSWGYKVTAKIFITRKSNNNTIDETITMPAYG